MASWQNNRKAVHGKSLNGLLFIEKDKFQASSTPHSGRSCFSRTSEAAAAPRSDPLCQSFEAAGLLKNCRRFPPGFHMSRRFSAAADSSFAAFDRDGNPLDSVLAAAEDWAQAGSWAAGVMRAFWMADAREFGFGEMFRLTVGYNDYTWYYLPENGFEPRAFTTSDAIPAIFAACMARSSFWIFSRLR